MWNNSMMAIRTIAFSLLFINVFVCADAQTVKVMSYNIRYDNPSDGVNAWPNRKKKVFELIKKYDPDILGVQEALLHQIKEITKALPEYDYIGKGRDDGKTKGEFSAILFKKAKFHVTSPETFWLSETPKVPGSKSWDAAITRVATCAKFQEKSKGTSFFIINTHFDHIGKEARKNSAGLIIGKLSQLKKLPVIVTGDLNCTREEDPYKVLMNSPVSLIDPAPADVPGTFCTFVVDSIQCNPIDYILHTREWSASNYDVADDHDGTHYPSDHLPVLVTLALKQD